MKGLYYIIGLILILCNNSCVTNYYTVVLEEDTPLYASTSQNSSIKTNIPKGTTVYINSRVKANHRKIKWLKYNGWGYNTNYRGSISNYSRSSYNSNRIPKYNSRSNSGTVHVKGYYRKDGTYVKPHTRSAPKRKYN